ncbi:uncharacterized protein G2W53_013378 [Senna tora]|uniref:Uncharacterized protein n=1 Tax=Senna tora TaxID=362788 RepID=A0A834TYS7_9FABA|nr:uncharacterized protein G2W53_013378 [Senna tora]
MASASAFARPEFSDRGLSLFVLFGLFFGRPQINGKLQGEYPVVNFSRLSPSS